MDIVDFRATGDSSFETDLLIVGAGPAGLAIARECFNAPFRVLVLESGGLKEDAAHAALNTVESVGAPRSPAQIERRATFHAEQAPFWRQDQQPYGVRCRVVGGATAAWAGKSAPFDPIDFEPRPWTPHSGWPISFAQLEPMLARAAKHLNLGPLVNGQAFWNRRPGGEPEPRLPQDKLQPFFWQFARSRIDYMDVLRAGPEFLQEEADNVRLLTHATAVEILTDAGGARATGVAIASLSGKRATVRARMVVLAASGIENPRLLLASRQAAPRGLGNSHDLVGRFLMDHPSARIARFKLQDIPKVQKRFGFYGLTEGAHTHMYMHGLALSPDLQREEGLLNAALYMMAEHAPDDPWTAFKRLIRGRWGRFGADLFAVAKSPGLLLTGLGIKALQSPLTPKGLKDFVVDTAIALNPNFVAHEFVSRGVPQNLTGLHVDAICEQAPDRDSRITLSDVRDALGVPLARVDWRLDPQALSTIRRLAFVLQEEFRAVGLPEPELAPWVVSGDPDEAAVIDMAHTLGTTRMATTPTLGVVDPDCRVFGVDGLYVAGGSVFPTSGHANPTLMIVALAVRLADHLRARLSQTRQETAA